jgi:hypothetical protein
MALMPKRIATSAVLSAVLMATAAAAAEPNCPQTRNEPVAQWVRDAETAIKIAKAVVEGSPYLGKFDGSRPLKAERYGDTWWVGVDRSECLRRPLWVCRSGGPVVLVRQDGRVDTGQQTD